MTVEIMISPRPANTINAVCFLISPKIINTPPPRPKRSDNTPNRTFSISMPVVIGVKTPARRAATVMM